ncbi:MAG: hypothetical protein SFV54_02325 [Bryobacteraceae bacterium]|nr:hypothetical protein [Bryobacteraceae bacterium]
MATVLICLLVSATALSQDTKATAAIKAKLARIPLGSDVEVVLHTGQKVRGKLVSVDAAEVTLSTTSSPVPIRDIKSVKRISSGPAAWHPVRGFARSWKVAAIIAGVILLAGVLVAANTR